MDLNREQLGFLMQMQMSDEELAADLRSASEMARDFLREQESESLLASLLCSTISVRRDGQDGQVKFEPTMAMNLLMSMEKPSAQLEALGAYYARQHIFVRAVYLTSEIWVSPDAGPGRRYARPADDPNRREAVGIMGTTIDGRSGYALLRVSRTPAGRLLPGKIDYEGGGKWQVVRGRLCEAFFIGYGAAMAESLHEDAS